VGGTIPVAAVLIASALSQQAPIRDSHVFHAATDLISVNVTVRTADGRLVTDLPREAFEVREDGALQDVSQFTAERVPLSLAILLDTSDSMFGSRLQDARDAINRFVGQLLDPSDEFALATFNQDMRVVLSWGHPASDAEAVLARVRSSGSTALYDGLINLFPLSDSRHRQRVAFLIISDGADTASDAKLRDVQAALNRSEAFVYAVAIDDPNRHAINTSVDPIALGAITNQTGGRTETVQSTAGVTGALERIAEELNHQYLLGYTPANRPDGQYHTIRVRVRDHPEYRVQARRGYVVIPHKEADQPAQR
jgi:Ca-activated chloride channel family protein